MIRCLLILLSLLCASCAVQSGRTYYANGNPKSEYFHADIGRNVAASSGGAESYAVVDQNETKSFAALMNLIAALKAMDAWADVEKGHQTTDQTAIKEGAATDRTGIVEGAQTERLRETETTKRILEGAGG